MTLAPASFFVGLEAAMKRASSETRAANVRQVTDMFVSHADGLNLEQINAFDDIFLAMIDHIEMVALIELSGRLAPIGAAPFKVVKRLASHDEISVAGPMLTTSSRLHWQDLEEIALTKGQAHLMAIASRHELDGSLTDVLLDQGDEEVLVHLAENSGARFSSNGYMTLVAKAEADARLALQVGLRLDLPLPLHHQLLMEATDAVRSQLLERAPAAVKEEIHRVLDEVASKIDEEMALRNDFADAEAAVRALHRDGQLNSATVLDFVKRGQFQEVSVAIALLCSAPIRTVADVIAGPRNDVVVAGCRAAQLDWPTTRAILCYRNPAYRISAEILSLAQKDFDRLQPATARQMVQTMKVRSVSSPTGCAGNAADAARHTSAAQT